MRRVCVCQAVRAPEPTGNMRTTDVLPKPDKLISYERFGGAERAPPA